MSVSVSVRSCLPTLLLAALSDPIEGALAAHPGSEQPIPSAPFISSLPFRSLYFTSLHFHVPPSPLGHQSSAHLPEPSRQPLVIPLYTSYKLQDRCLMNNTPLVAAAGHSPYYASTTSSSSSRMLVASRKERCSGKMLILAVFFDLRVLAHHGPLVLLGRIWSITPYSSRTDSSVAMGTRDKTEQNLIYKLEKALLISTYTSVTATLHIITTVYTSCRDFPRCGAV